MRLVNIKMSKLLRKSISKTYISKEKQQDLPQEILKQHFMLFNSE